MSRKLNSLNKLPNSQPFNQPAFGSYQGFEYAFPEMFTRNPNIVDWVLLELRKADSPNVVVTRKAVFVQQDGALMDIFEPNFLDSITPNITFPGIINANYYVVIRHRNHLAIRSSSPVVFSSGHGGYDFTTSAGKAFQNQGYTSTVNVGGKWAMRAGNANADNTVKYNGPFNDQNQISNIKLAGLLNQPLNNVYAAEDVNMDGDVIATGTDNDLEFLLNKALSGSLSQVYKEQL